MPIFSWSVSFLRPYRIRVSIIVLLAIAEIGLAALAPWPMKAIVDNVFGGQPFPSPLAGVVDALSGGRVEGLLITVALAGLALQLLLEVVRGAHTQVQVAVGQRIVYDLRARLLAHLQALPLRHHVLGRTADSVYRLESDAYCVNDLVIGGVFPLAAAALNLTVMFVILMGLDPTLGLLSLAVAPFLYVSLRYYSRTMTDRAERVKLQEATLVDRAYEILSSIAAIKSFARERHELGRFLEVGESTMQARLRLTWQESLFSLCVTAITLAGTALVLIVGGLHVLQGTLTIGGLLVVIAYLAAVYGPLSAIAHTTGALQQARVSARRVREMFALAPEPLDAADAIDAAGIVGHVAFDNVSFAYDGSWPPTWWGRRRHARHTSTTSLRGCRRAIARRWPRRAPRCRAASGSASGSPARCSRMRPSSSSTSPRRRSTRFPRRPSSMHCGDCAKGAPRSSSRTVSRRFAMPTGSWCCTKAA
jgi:ABC-type multidrug transport system fused ATPase/permease subunit